jgi:hypothetical protein
METLVISNSRWRYILLLFVCVGFVVTGIFLVKTADTTFETWAGWPAIIFFGAGIPLFIWQIVDRRPRLTINELGINDRTMGVGLIPWAEITDSYVKSIRGNHFICLVARNPEIWTSKFSTAKKAMIKANKALGFTELNVNLSGTSAQPQEIHELILKLSASSRENKH